METDHVALVRGGPAYRLAVLLGLGPVSWRRRLTKMALLFFVTWMPLAILTLSAGSAWGDAVHVPFFRDPVVHSRFLFVLPLLEIADIAVAASLILQTGYFLESGIVPRRERARFDAAKAAVVSWRRSTLIEFVLLGVAIAVVFARVQFGVNSQETNWERVGTAISPAGWWYNFVALPILFFFLLRWALIFSLWAWFLFRVSRLDLELTATHPDRSGGLGFLGWGLASFALVLMAFSAVVSGGFAYGIIHHGESLDSLKYHLIIFVVAALAALHAPLLAFSGRLSRTRFRALLEFGALVWRHDREFDEKWVRNLGPESPNPLGSPDISSLADIAAAYEHVERMQLIPIDKQTVIVLFAAAVIPMLPLISTAIPLTDILKRLAGLFLGVGA